MKKAEPVTNKICGFCNKREAKLAKTSQYIFMNNLDMLQMTNMYHKVMESFDDLKRSTYFIYQKIEETIN